MCLEAASSQPPSPPLLPRPLSHGVLAKLDQPRVALSALRDLTSWPSMLCPESAATLMSLASQGWFAFFLLLLHFSFQTIKFLVVQKKVKRGSCWSKWTKKGGKRQEKSPEGKGRRHLGSASKWDRRVLPGPAAAAWPGTMFYMEIHDPAQNFATRNSGSWARLSVLSLPTLCYSPETIPAS